MPFRRPDAETPGEAIKKLAGESDFGDQYQRLTSLAQDSGDGFEIDFRLARSGDALQQGRGEMTGSNQFLQGCRCRSLRRVELRGDEISIRQRFKLPWRLHQFQNTGLHQTIDDGRRYAALSDNLSLAAGETIAKQIQHPRPRHRLLLRAATVPAQQFRRHARFAVGLMGAQGQTQHHPQGRHRPARDPDDELAQAGSEHRRVEHRADGAKLARRHIFDRAIPHAADHMARTKRHLDQGSRRKRLIRLIGIGPLKRQRQQHTDEMGRMSADERSLLKADDGALDIQPASVNDRVSADSTGANKDISMIAAHVTALYHYPVKGLSAQPLAAVTLTAGLAFPGDRLFAIENGPSGFDPTSPAHLPKIRYLMLARHGRLARLATHYDDMTHILSLRSPDGDHVEADLTSAEGRSRIEAFLTTFLGNEARGPLRVLSAPGYHFMDSPKGFVSLINLASLRAIEKCAGGPVDPLRFRGNIYVDGLAPWQEFDLVGHRLRIGEAELTGLKRTDRCAATQVNPRTGERDIDMLRLLEGRFNHHDCGIYLRVTRSGRMAADDHLTMLGRDLGISDAQP